MSIDINLNVNVYVGADKTLTDALVYAGGWAACLYKVLHPHATKPPITKEDVDALKENSEYPRKSKQEQAEKPPVAASEGVPTEGASVPAKSEEKAPETAKPPEEKPKAETPAFVRPKPGEIRAAIRSYIGEPEDEEHDARSEVLSKWMSENSISSIPNATDEQVQAFLAFIEEKKKEGTVHA